MKCNSLIKSAVLAALPVVLAASSLRADSARFSESYVDRLASYSIDGTRYYTTVPVDSASFHCTLQVSNLAQAQFDSSTYLMFSLGDYSFEASLGDANVITANSATFYQYLQDAFGRNHKIGQITFTRRGNVLTVSAASGFLEDKSVAASQFIGMPGPVKGEVNLSISAGDLMVQRILYFRGSSRTITKTVGSDELTFNIIKVSGAADFTKPAITFYSPRSGTHLTNNTPTLRLKVSDNIGINSVFVSVNSSMEFTPASAEAAPNAAFWDSSVTLLSGTNVLRAYAVDLSGNTSRLATIKVIAP